MLGCWRVNEVTGTRSTRRFDRLVSYIDDGCHVRGRAERYEDHGARRTKAKLVCVLGDEAGGAQYYKTEILIPPVSGRSFRQVAVG